MTRIKQIAKLLILLLTLVACENSKSKENRQQQEQTNYTTPVYLSPYYQPQAQSSNTTPAEQGVSNPVQNQQEDFRQISEVHISRYYEEGYDKGYDDGEDDAVMDNGWGGQYDDECHYTGKKKKEYQLGYEEGYEAGYYDNKDSDE